MGLGNRLKKLFGSDQKNDENLKSQQENGIIEELSQDEVIDKSIDIDDAEFMDNKPIVESVEIVDDASEKEEVNDDSTPTRNFRYLDELIHSGVKELVLDSDIVLDDEEESDYKDGIKLDLDDLTIDGNGYTIDAKGKIRIFLCNGKNITLNYIKLKNGFAQDNGGAIFSNGELTITNSIIDGNTAKQGGAIYNNGELTVKDSVLSENTSKQCGIIKNTDGTLKIFNCKIVNNHSPNSIIDNKTYLQIYNTDFTQNESGNIIFNHEDASDFGIFYGQFMDNNVDESVIVNDGTLCTIEKTIFENGLSTNIINQSNLILINPELRSDDKTILNNGVILLKKPNRDYSNEIYGEGRVEDYRIGDGKFSFEYLDALIHKSCEKIIFLNHDICFEMFELDFYDDGILLDIDDLVIDGGGHTIDAKGLSRIFRIAGRNITVKNLFLKNGFQRNKFHDSGNGGGAILINEKSSLYLMDCSIMDNRSENIGGAILNYGMLKSQNNCFVNNSSKSFGGAVFNDGMLEIDYNAFRDNKSQIGSAICNKQNLFINNAIDLSDNRSKIRQAIYNQGKVECNFELDGEYILDDIPEESETNEKDLKIGNDEFNS